MIDTAKHIQREFDRLPPFACKNAESRARRHPEAEHPYRPPFERDRERIVHSSSFRRLTYKTQVFVNHEGDHYRTRLTHTIETATVARAVAYALGLSEDLTEAISLAHDLGHTPFGHTGEEILNELLADRGGFEHNNQSLRVVDHLERRYRDFDGLNLTYETREGIQKHVTRYDSADANNEFPGRWPSAEAQVVCVADEIAYMCHDLDDGVYSGLLDEREMRAELPLWRRIAEEVLSDYPKVDAEGLRKETIRRLINYQVTDAVEESDRRLAEMDPGSVDEIREAEGRVIGHSPELEAENELIGAYLFENLYRHYKVLRMSTKANLVMKSLFEAYTDTPKMLPRGSRRRLEVDDVPIVVADYIAGMTDRYAMLEYKKLFDPYEKLL